MSNVSPQGLNDGVHMAIDIGGTFTDGVAWRESDGAIVVAKSLTTPDDPGEACSTVAAALLEQLDAGTPVSRVVHGTTLVTNTLVERRGARAALILTRGTEDSLDIRRELRYDTYDLKAEYPAALIDRTDRFPLSARLGPDGSEWAAVDATELADITETVATSGCAAVAVCLLHSPVDGRHEQAVVDALRARLPGVVVCASSDVAPEIGEYERMSTVAANAYVMPIVGDYLRALAGRMAELDVHGALHIMLSNGAFTTAGIAADAPIRILESGPAGGVLSAVNCARAEGIDRVLAFDMGGTTAKACVAVDARPSVTHVFEFGRVRRFKRGSGLPAVAPSIDLIEIGAGGGSLASVSELGLLQVGPQSAGAVPGPACYGRGGTEATVTDADLLLGYLDADSFLGGRMQLDVEEARAALARTGEPLGLDAQATALGIHDIVNENMAAAARTHIAEQGLDARTFAMVATGGAGPVHAVDVARRLRIPRVLCPIASGVGSCLGFLAAPARADRAWSRVETLSALDGTHFRARYAQARDSAERDLAECGVPVDAVQWAFTAAVRYVGQGNAVDVTLADPGRDGVPAAEDVVAAFETEYARLYHKTVPGGVPEVVTWRLVGSSVDQVRRFRLDQPATPAPTGERRLFRADTREYATVPVHERASLPPGSELTGPVIITEPESTLVVAVAATVVVHASGTLDVRLETSS